MIKELSELGKKLRDQKTGNEWVHDALKEEPISLETVISEDGNFQKFELFEKKPTIAEAITAKKGKARLLLDKAEEVLCYGGETSKKKHELFLEKIAKYQELPELSPVLAFYKQNRVSGVDKALKEFEIAIPDEKNRKGNIGFRVQNEGTRIHEKPEVLRKIIEKYETAQKEMLAKSQKNCSVCGKTDYPVEDIPHGMIKKVPDGQSSGCALISYNENAFESYELEGNNNSSICTNCAKTYVEGLNWLLSSGNEITDRSKRGKEKKTFRYTILTAKISVQIRPWFIGHERMKHYRKLTTLKRQIRMMWQDLLNLWHPAQKEIVAILSLTCFILVRFPVLQRV